MVNGFQLQMITEIKKNRFWYEIAYNPIFNDKNKIKGITLFIFNITDRKKTEEALRESEEKYRDLVETSQDLIWRCDSEGRFTYLNPKFKETHEYDIEEMIGKPFTDLADEETVEEDVKQFKKLMDGRKVIGFETKHISKSGKKINLVINAIPIFDKTGNSIGAQGTAFDITDIKNAEREKLQHERLKGVLELAGAASHEMNQPLQVISGYSELLLQPKKTPNELNKDLRIMKENCKKLGEITLKLQNITHYKTKDYLDGKIIDIDEASRI